MTVSTVDEAKLQGFVAQALGELGATLNAALVVIGDRLGLYKAMARRGRADRARARRAHRIPTSATCASGSTPRPRAATSPTTPDRPLRAARRAGGGARRRGQPGLPARRLPADDRRRARRAADHRGLPHRRRASAGTSTTPPVRRHRALLPPRLRATSSRRGSRRSTASRPSCEAGAKVADVGCGHGASTVIMAEAFPASAFRGFDYHEGSIERARRPQHAGRRRPRALRGRERQDFPRRRTTTS